MAEEKIEEHEHTATKTEEGKSETHSEKVVEKEEKKPEVTTVKEETTIEDTD